MARRPARGLSSPLWSMAGLAPTSEELEPCFPILPTSSIVASSELLCRALFSRMGASHSMGTAALHFKSCLKADRALPARCVTLPRTAPPTPAGPKNPRLGP